ncbi:MAG: helicase-related protein [Patescibacteria group bacterium]
MSIKINEYRKFLANKQRRHIKSGFDPKPMPSFLREDQKQCIDSALIAGRYCIFADCGLGKTLDELEWARQVCEYTNNPVLILAPLCVGIQTIKEGERFGYVVNKCLDHTHVKNGINITNYERLSSFDPCVFSGIVLDESSILKNFAGKTRCAIIESFEQTPYKLACTATPSPNDHMELGNHSEFVGSMTRSEMLSMYFIHDGGSTQDWRLKGHAVEPFWEWVKTWSVAYRKPSDINLSFSDEGFNLPSLNIKSHYVGQCTKATSLFGNTVSGISDHRAVKRASASMRADACAEIAGDDYCVVWAELNDEADALEKCMNAPQLKGSQSIDQKEEILWAFTNGEIKKLITKQKITSFGLNWQHCNRTLFCGSGYSFEGAYQAIKRFHRFGQKRDVDAIWVMADEEETVFDLLKIKMKLHEETISNVA